MAAQLYYNGSIFTQNKALPIADSLLVKENIIAAIHGIPSSIDAELIDLKGRTIVPAFSDPHIHIWKVGELLTFRLDLRGVQSLAEMLDQIGQSVPPTNESGAQQWVLARGFNEVLFPNPHLPTRHDLDKVCPHLPCQVIRTCAHIAVLNTRALEICGIHAQTPVPEGGEIRLDANGIPNGILTETALGLVTPHLPVIRADQYRTMILAAQDALMAVGIHAATDPAVHPALLDVYYQMATAGELKIKIHAIPIRVPDGSTIAAPLPHRFESEFLTVNTVKFFADGGISGKTAALLDPYKNTDERGIMRLQTDFFLHLARESQASGFKIATHAIGDAAIGQVLEVYKQLDRDNHEGLRHRIEHLGLPTAQHLQQMQSLGTWCVSQPTFLKELGINFRQYLPDSYLNHIYPYRSMLDAGVSLAFSSDAPVVKDFDPRTGIQHAMTRTDTSGATIAPAEALTFEEALRAYTVAPAELNNDSQLGTIEVGKKANFVFWDE